MKTHAAIVLLAVGLPALSQPPRESNPSSGPVASNASVSLDSPDSNLEGGGDSTPAERLDEEKGHQAGADSSVRTGGAHPVVIPRSSTSDVKKSEAPRASWSWLKSGVMPLAAVLGVIGTVYWAVRRWLPAARTMDKSALLVVARAAITPKHTVALVHVGRRFVLVGVSGDRMERLETIADSEEVADLLAATRSTDVDRGPFIEALERESGSYVQAVEALEEPTTDPQPGGVRATEQLGALLRRLRRLQSR